jgi:hypothetical protein
MHMACNSTPTLIGVSMETASRISIMVDRSRQRLSVVLSGHGIYGLACHGARTGGQFHQLPPRCHSVVRARVTDAA